MSDKYLELANSTIGKKIFAAVGLPDPVPLTRENPRQPHKLSGDLLLGTSDGAAFATTMNSFVAAAGVNVQSESLPDSGNLLFDASGITNAEQSQQLYHFFNQHIRSLAPSGRVLLTRLIFIRSKSACFFYFYFSPE